MSNRINAVKVAGFLGAALFASSPSWAQTISSGQVGIEYGPYEVRFTGFKQQGDIIHVDAAYVVPLGGNLGLQIDGSVQHSSGASESAAVSANLFYRTEHFSIGAFAGVGHTWAHDAPNDRHIAGGVEANVYFGPVSLGAAYAFIDSEALFGTSASGFDITARILPTDQFSLEAKYSNVDVNYGPFDSGNQVWRVGAEYQPSGWPVSFQAAFSHNNSDLFDVTIERYSIGIRYNFGTGSLRQRHRQGASMIGYSSEFLVLG